jgi:hypothetical protein
MTGFQIRRQTEFFDVRRDEGRFFLRTKHTDGRFFTFYGFVTITTSSHIISTDIVEKLNNSIKHDLNLRGR